MIKDNKLWKELIRLFSVEGQPTTTVLVQMYGCIFHSVSVWYTIFFQNHRGPPGNPPQATVLETLL
jgi:hypothetical protein